MRDRSVTYKPELVFHAVADPTRRALLELLCRGKQSAGKIAASFPVSRPAVAKQLALLRRAHLVEVHRAGRHQLYELNAEPLKIVDHWLNSYRVFWRANLSSLKNFIENEVEPTKRKPRRTRKENSAR